MLFYFSFSLKGRDRSSQWLALQKPATLSFRAGLKPTVMAPVLAGTNICYLPRMHSSRKLDQRQSWNSLRHSEKGRLYAKHFN